MFKLLNLFIPIPIISISSQALKKLKTVCTQTKNVCALFTRNIESWKNIFMPRVQTYNTPTKGCGNFLDFFRMSTICNNIRANESSMEPQKIMIGKNLETGSCCLSSKGRLRPVIKILRNFDRSSSPLRSDVPTKRKLQQLDGDCFLSILEIPKPTKMRKYREYSTKSLFETSSEKSKNSISKVYSISQEKPRYFDWQKNSEGNYRNIPWKEKDYDLIGKCLQVYNHEKVPPNKMECHNKTKVTKKLSTEKLPQNTEILFPIKLNDIYGIHGSESKEEPNKLKKERIKGSTSKNKQDDPVKVNPKNSFSNTGCRLAYELALVKRNNELDGKYAAENDPSWTKQTVSAKLKQKNKEEYWNSVKKKWEGFPHNLLNNENTNNHDPPLINDNSVGNYRLSTKYPRIFKPLVINNVFDLFDLVKKEKSNPISTNHMNPIDGIQNKFINNALSSENVELKSVKSKMKDEEIKNYRYSCDYVKYNSDTTVIKRSSLKEYIKKQENSASKFFKSEPSKNISYKIFETEPKIHLYDTPRENPPPLRKTHVKLKNTEESYKYNDDFYKKSSITQSCPFFNRSNSPSSISDESEQGRHQDIDTLVRKSSLSQSASRLAYDAVISKIVEENRIKDMSKKLFKKSKNKKFLRLRSVDTNEPLWLRIAKKWNVVSDSRVLDDSFKFNPSLTYDPKNL
ncbi:uncharacterized protein LOC130896047 isoform X2 [Diorhabda carinulata]|uniref:uncharacterized protein LOC130896047 isoform X2 n=1 Tax=Diorhabda carinulata TaxID=1163345 RepID=UPI0025A15E00|nr:uncharacterized protein LOC130896047 isoform X2 [Diorhabda carinulata]